MSDQLSSAPTDRYFVLRDSHELFQRRLVEIARHAGIVAPAVVEALRQALGEAHDEMASAAQRAGFEQADGLTASRITLMGEDDLDLEIRIGELAKRLGDIGGTALWKAHLRYMTLLNRPGMEKTSNPVGPEAIVPGLWAICRESGGTLASKLALLARLEGLFREELPAFYGEINDLLARHGVEAAVVQPVLTGSAVRTGGEGGGTGAPVPVTGADPLATLQHTLARQTGGAAGGTGAGSGDVALSAANLAMLNQLLARLSALDIRPAADAPTADSPAGQALLRSVKAKELGLPSGGPESIALDTLGRIFEAIFDTPDLPDAVKNAIGRLQIPLLKLAIVDPTFFADAAHPARRLVNGMARAALGLPRNVGREHPLCAHLERLGITVGADLESDSGKLDQHLGELDALITERNTSVQTSAQAYLPLMLEHERGLKAMAGARRWLADLEEQEMAPEIRHFLAEHWLRVMQAASLEGGEEGSRWRADAATIDDLLWSVRQKPAAEDRKRLAGLVPGLLKRLNDGLDRIGVDNATRAGFLDACFALQTAALRGTGHAVTVAPTTPPVAANDDALPTTQTIDVAGRKLHCLQLSNDGRSPYRSATPPWKIGDWLQFQLIAGKTRCGRLCWLSPNSGTALLCNPDWGDAVALSPAVVEQQMRAGQARVVSAQGLFDSAAERALRRLSRP